MAKQFLSTPENWVKHFSVLFFQLSGPKIQAAKVWHSQILSRLKMTGSWDTFCLTQELQRIGIASRHFHMKHSFWVDIFQAILLYHSAWNLRTSAFLGQTDVRLRGNDFYLWLTSDHRYSVHYFPHLKYWFALKCSFKMCLMIFIAQGSVRYRVQ